jgi:hypothetical protein
MSIGVTLAPETGVSAPKCRNLGTREYENVVASFSEWLDTILFLIQWTRRFEEPVNTDSRPPVGAEGGCAVGFGCLCLQISQPVKYLTARNPEYTDRCAKIGDCRSDPLGDQAATETPLIPGW